MNAVLRDEPSAAYHQRSLETATASGLKHILRSPAHFHHWATTRDDKESPALTFGRAFHCATLEPEVFAQTYTVVSADAPRYPTAAQWGAKGKRSPDSQAAVDYWLAWNEANAGRIKLPAEDYDRALRMADSVRAHPVAAGLLVGGDREVTFKWQDEATGLRCKSRADLYLAGEYLMDLKSCRDASLEGFARSVASYHYDLQAAHYLDGIRSNGDAIKWFVFLACESEAPYVCQPYILDANAEQRGFTLRNKAITRQAECVQTGRWPGYSDQLSQLTLPAWAFFNLDETA